MPKALDLTGQKFGLLTAKEKLPSQNGKTYWLCVCECGTEKAVQTGHLTSGAICSCGCQKFATIELTCPICGKVFTTSSNTRKYCFECSPGNDVDRSQAITTYRKAVKKRLIELHGGKCQRCGYNKSLRALEFHHRNPKDKIFGISQSDRVRSWEEYVSEAEKCELLCANCHAEEHDRLNNINE